MSKQNKVTCLVALWLASFSSSGIGEINVWLDSRFSVVVAKVESVETYRESTVKPPMLVARLTITDVLWGANKFLDQPMEALTCEAPVTYGHFYVSPALKNGESGVFVVAAKGAGEIEMSIAGRYLVGKDELPTFKDRNPDYNAVLQRLRHRRDHPEDYKDEEWKKPVPNPPPNAAPLKLMSLPEPPASKALAPVPLEKEPIMSAEGWLTTGAALLLLVTLILKRRGVLK